MPDTVDTATAPPAVEEANLGANELLTARIKESLFPEDPIEEPQSEGTDPEPEAAMPEEEPEPEDPITAETEDPLEKVPGWQKRIDKLTSQKSNLEGRLEEIEQQKSELESQLRTGNSKPDQDFAGLVSNVTSITQLEKLEQETSDSERWAKRLQNQFKRNPEGVEAELNKRFGSDIDDPESFLDDLVLNAEDARQFILPKAKKRVQATEQWRAVAVETYPWLEDQTSQAGALVKGIIQKHGNKRLNEIPEVQLVLARAVVGYAEEQKRLTKPKAQRPEPTRQPGRPAGSAPRKPSSADDADEAARQVLNGGGRDALKSFTLKALMPK